MHCIISNADENNFRAEVHYALDLSTGLMP